MFLWVRSMSEECKKSKDGKHEPDWDSVSLDSDGGEVYVDVSCKHCGEGGCVGTSKTLADDIDW